MSATATPLDAFALDERALAAMDEENQEDYDPKIWHIRRQFREALRRRVGERDDGVFIINVNRKVIRVGHAMAMRHTSERIGRHGSKGN